jgi:hypothetical protein
MLIERDGQITNKKVEILLMKDNGTIITLDENQFFQWTPTEKRIELWEGKEEFLKYRNGEKLTDEENFKIRRVCYWNRNSVCSVNIFK